VSAIRAIDHVQIAIPVGGEDVARPFYEGLLGLTEVAKPPVMAARGGAWYQSGAVKVHLGVEADFRANDKAHVAFVVDNVAALAARAAAAGYTVKHDDELPGFVRAFLYDPFGNRIEILRALGADG
jgi:catechol 2,3-dioxygenase-like lactoylglutathione lyase family enzyme